MEFERRRGNHSHLSIAPLVDVVFLLLLFFMLTSHWIQEPAIRIRLPESTTAESLRDTPRTITLTKNGEIYFMEKRVDIKNLRAAIQTGFPDQEKGFLRIKADKEADVGLLVSVIDEVRRSDVNTFSIVTERR
jgi:biopolymer transport protein ExbD